MKYSDLKLRSSISFNENILERVKEMSSLTKEERKIQKEEVKTYSIIHIFHKYSFPRSYTQ